MKIGASFYNADFLPLGVNYMDPDNFRFRSIDEDRKAEIIGIDPFYVKGSAKMILKVKQTEHVRLLRVKADLYSASRGLMGPGETVIDGSGHSAVITLSSQTHYLLLSFEAQTDDVGVQLYDIGANFYLIDQKTDEGTITDPGDLLYKGPDLKNRKILDEEVSIVTKISNPISLETLNNKILVYDANDGNIGDQKEIVSNTYGTCDYRIGDWEINYKVTNSINATSNLKVKIKVLDDIYPVFRGVTNLETFNTDPVTVDEIKNQLTADDNYDGDITDRIVLYEDKLTNRREDLGTFRVVFRVADTAGNTTQRTVNVTVKQGDVTPPVIGGELEQFYYTDEPKTIEDILSKLTITDDYTSPEECTIDVLTDNYQYNSQKKGNFGITIQVKDKAGNAQTAQITVTVRYRCRPIFVLNTVNITLPLQNNMQSVETLTTYLQKTHYLSAVETEIISDEYTENRNKAGAYRLVLAQNDSRYDIIVNVREKEEYEQSIDIPKPKAKKDISETIYDIYRRIKALLKDLFRFRT